MSFDVNRMLWACEDGDQAYIHNHLADFITWMTGRLGDAKLDLQTARRDLEKTKLDVQEKDAHIAQLESEVAQLKEQLEQQQRPTNGPRRIIEP
jgi:chromosome segregation ATPase